MTNNDENVVRTRLLLDGDGTGDDRRLNNISKMVSLGCRSQLLLHISLVLAFLKCLSTKLFRVNTQDRGSQI
jgi:hypothetical protein